MVALVLLGGFTLLFTQQKTRPELVMLGMLTIFMAAGIITPQQGLKGFSNSGLATVAVLFVIATAISSAGVDDFVGALLGRPTNVPTALLRLTIPVIALSSFVNDTPIVVIMLPVVTAWCRTCRLPANALLMPLSYAALLGGTVTLVGTSANLVVAGQYRRRYLDPDSENYDPDATHLEMFELTRYGVPAAVWGVVYMLLTIVPMFGGRRRHTRTSSKSMGAPQLDGTAPQQGEEEGMSSDDDDEEETVDDFMVGLQVQPASPCVGKSIEAAGLRGLPGLFLVCVRRRQETFHAVGPEFVLAAGDVLYFTGVLDNHVIALAAQHALLPYTHDLEELDSPLATASGHSPRSDPGTSSFFSSSLPPTPQHRRRRTVGSPFARASVAHPPVSAGPPKLVRATIRPTAPIVGSTIKAANFRKRYNASIVAVQRDGKNLVGIRLGEVTVTPGDVLLMDVGPSFWTLGKEGRDTFDHVALLRARVGEEEEKQQKQAFSNNTTSKTTDPQVLSREFMLPMEVTSTAVAGKTVEAAGLRGLPDGFLVSIEREGTMLHAVAPSEVLHVGDILWFACRADSVVSIRRVPGLQPHRSTQVDKLKTTERRLVQAVIATHSPLAGHSVKQLRFRTRFDAAIVAVHRQGVRIRAKIGEIVLRPGDVLLLDTGAHFLTENRNGPLFALISEIENSAPPRGDRLLVIGVTAAAFALAAVGVGELVVLLMLAVGVLVTLGCMSREQVLSSVRWDVVVMIGGAFGIAEAVRASGLAQALCTGLLLVVGAHNTVAVVAVVYIVTAALCQVVANNAAVALVYPIASTMGDAAGVDPHVLACVVMLAGSATYASPFSYATNLMVFAAGGYKTRDFLVVGGGMQVWHAVVVVIAVVVHGAWAWLVVGGVAMLVLVYACMVWRIQHRCKGGVGGAGSVGRGSSSKGGLRAGLLEDGVGC